MSFFDLVITVFLPLSLAVIMFSLGVGLVVGDFVRVVVRPLSFLTGAFNQLLLVPFVTFLIIVTFGIEGELAVGMMILSACPGGVTSNVLSKWAQGDVALSVTLTAVISFVSIISVPLIVSFAMGYFMSDSGVEVSITDIILRLFLLSAVPVALGMTLRHFFPKVMIGLEPLLNKIAVVLFLLIFILACAAGWNVLMANAFTLGPALLTLITVLLLAGYFLSVALGRSTAEAKTISIETGLQNTPMGVTIGTIVATDALVTGYTLPAGVYGVVMFIPALAAIYLFRKSSSS
ncbi:bile acid:sodium symporter family protein [Ruegeria jejuensis]|uniref:bile acid:sodium symporter family protein n=1 Tax=Ruegeria jejuensis TaxID=3233338 RepID=UPI00355B767E